MKGKILNNYWGQLIRSYPEKAEMLEWMKYFLDNRMYYYGEQSMTPYEGRTANYSLRTYISRFFHRFWCSQIYSKDYFKGAVICNAYFNIENYIKEKGFKVTLPPWQTGSLTRQGMNTLYQMEYADFNTLLTDCYQKQIYALKDEIRCFLQQNETPFVLLANDLVPVHRMIIDVCKELKIPSGIFLHGLPARYNSIDDSRADYLFVWGDKIKENYISAGSKAQIIVTGHPCLSSIIIDDIKPVDVVVLSKPTGGAPSSSNIHTVDDRGLSIQHIYAVETALKRVGINHAVLRLHPCENPLWYSKYMDKEFYTLDIHSLSETLGNAKMLVGHISTVMLDTVLNDIPCYPFVIDHDSNPYASEIVPPFNNKLSFPTSTTVDELEYNIKNCNYVTKQHFAGYVNSSFDINNITRCFKIRNRK